MFRATQPYLNLLVKPRIFFRFSGKKYNLMHFERRNDFQNVETIFFPRKKKCLEKINVPTLPKTLRPITRNTLIFFCLTIIQC